MLHQAETPGRGAGGREALAGHSQLLAYPIRAKQRWHRRQGTPALCSWQKMFVSLAALCLGSAAPCCVDQGPSL